MRSRTSVNSAVARLASSLQDAVVDRAKSMTVLASLSMKSVGARSLGCGGLGIAGGLVVALLVVAAVSYPTLRRGYAVNKDICNLNGVGDMGTIGHRGAQPGELLQLRRATRVFKQTPTGERSCLLPRGSRVRVGEARKGEVLVVFDPENALPSRPKLMRLLFGAPRN